MLPYHPDTFPQLSPFPKEKSQRLPPPPPGPNTDRNLVEGLGVVDASTTPGYKVSPGISRLTMFSRVPPETIWASLGKAGRKHWRPGLHHLTRPPVEGKGQQEQEHIWEPRLLGHPVRSRRPALVSDTAYPPSTTYARLGLGV